MTTDTSERAVLWVFAPPLLAGADGASATALQPPPHLLTTLPAPAGGGRRVRPDALAPVEGRRSGAAG